MVALAQGAGGRVAAGGYRVSLGDDERVLKLMCGFWLYYADRTPRYTTHFKWMNCVVCELYFSKAVK